MPTVNYPFSKLYGPGTSSIDLIKGTAYTFTITNNSGSNYFILETKSTSSPKPKNTSGSFSSLNNIGDSVSSDYITGFALKKGTNSFVFTPAANVIGTSLKLRGTGGINLTLSY